MKIIGFLIKKILVDVKEGKRDNLDVKSNLNLDDVKEGKVALTKQPSILINFNFFVDYSPDIARIEIKGHLILLDDENKKEEIMTLWKQRQLPEEIKLPILNYILEKCNVKALQFEEELGLPLHLPLPKISQQKLKTQPQKEEKSDSKSKKSTSYTG
jgi:hypothetical protein